MTLSYDKKWGRPSIISQLIEHIPCKNPPRDEVKPPVLRRVPDYKEPDKLGPAEWPSAVVAAGQRNRGPNEHCVRDIRSRD